MLSWTSLTSFSSIPQLLNPKINWHLLEMFGGGTSCPLFAERFNYMMAALEYFTGLETVCLRLPQARLKKQGGKQSTQASRARRGLVLGRVVVV